VEELMARATSEGEYFWIRQWGTLMGSDGDDIEREIEKARRDRAPHNAIYYGSDSPDARSTPGGGSDEHKREQAAIGRWQTTADITQVDTRLLLERKAGRPLPENEERGG
jgi:hypothetical protein